MTSLFAPPELLCAWSYAVDGSDPGETLRRGTHLRVFGGLGPSFPLTPFAVFKVTTRTADLHLHYTDDQGRPIAFGDLPQFRTVNATPEFPPDDIHRTIGLEFFPSQLAGFEAQLLDTHGRLVASRRTPKFLFSAPTLSKFRLSGEVISTEFLRHVVSIDDVLAQGQQPPAVLLGLPVTGARSWYVGIHDHNAAMKRVSNGAPTRLNAMDRPDGPFDPIGPADEVARVEAALSSVTFGNGLEQLVAAMVSDGATPPWQQAERQPLHDRGQIADIPRLASLQMAAIDPGLARFLGFAERIDDLPDLSQREGRTALAVAGLLAIDPQLATQLPHLTAWLQHPDPREQSVIDMIIRSIAAVSGHDVGSQVSNLIATSRRVGLIVRAVVTVTAPVPPWLAPVPTTPVVLDHRWQAPAGNAESSHYRATFSFPRMPLAGMAAVAADLGGGWVSRHQMLAVSGSISHRAAPRIFAHESDPSARVRGMLTAGTSAALQRAALVSDQDLPASAGTLTYRFRAADFFGRFGDPVETTIDPPPPPPPPPPVLRYYLDLVTDGLEQLPASGPLSPGTLRLTFATPQPSPAAPFPAADDGRLRTAIAVPGPHDLAAGSQPIQTTTVTLDGDVHEVDVSTPGLVELALPLAGLQPQEQGQATLTATFRDTVGVQSKPASVTFTITDKRPLQPIETGIGLFWTSAPSPAPDVQLKLTWRAGPNALHRVYITDQRGLRLTDAELAEPVPGAAPSRARVAEVGAKKVLGGGPIDRNQFRLLPETVQADGNGLAVLDTTLPRSLQTVQFLRIVPLSSEGTEAPFDRCGIVPVAVPNSRRPPRPRLDGNVDTATGFARFAVTADGFDGVTLRRDEPGLFNPAVGPAVAPWFRIRRAVSAVADPLYAHQIADGPLAHDASADPATVFSGEGHDRNNERGLEPFVPYVYWAEVRLPPERRLPAGVASLDAGVTASDPANAADYPQPVSLPSAPRTLMRIPPNPPAAPEPAHVNVLPVATLGGKVIQFAIDITGPPAAHPKAIGPFRLAIWSQWPRQPIQAITIANDRPLNGIWPDLGAGSVTITVSPPEPPASPAGPIMLRLAYVDPAGRLGALTTINVP